MTTAGQKRSFVDSITELISGKPASNEEEEEAADGYPHPEEKYNIGKVLGQGAFGIVVLATVKTHDELHPPNELESKVRVGRKVWEHIPFV